MLLRDEYDTASQAKNRLHDTPINRIETSAVQRDSYSYGGDSDKAAAPTFRVYLREMGEHPLLNGKEEIKLSQEMEAGRKSLLETLLTTDFGQKRLQHIFDSIRTQDLNYEKFFGAPVDGAVGRALEERKTVYQDTIQPFRRVLSRISKAKPESQRAGKDRAKLIQMLIDAEFDPTRIDRIAEDFREDEKRTRRGRGARSMAAKEISKAQRRIENARTRMVQGNLRLVISVSRRYRNHGLDMLDLIQEGNLGLLKAVDRFDYKKGCKFSTYAVWWIRQTIRRAITSQVRQVRLPANVAELLTRMFATIEDLRHKLHREPLDDEIAEILEVEADFVRHLKRVSQSSVSLDTPVGTDGETTIGHSIMDDNAIEIADEAGKDILAKRLEEILPTLNEREEAVVRLRYGLTDGEPWTLEEVADRFGVTRERIRQIEVRALRKLRHPRRTLRIRGFVS